MVIPKKLLFLRLNIEKTCSLFYHLSHHLLNFNVHERFMECTPSKIITFHSKLILYVCAYKILVLIKIRKKLQKVSSSDSLMLYCVLGLIYIYIYSYQRQ